MAKKSAKSAMFHAISEDLELFSGETWLRGTRRGTPVGEWRGRRGRREGAGAAEFRRQAGGQIEGQGISPGPPRRSSCAKLWAAGTGCGSGLRSLAGSAAGTGERAGAPYPREEAAERINKNSYHSCLTKSSVVIKNESSGIVSARYHTLPPWWKREHQQGLKRIV